MANVIQQLYVQYLINICLSVGIKGSYIKEIKQKKTSMVGVIGNSVMKQKNLVLDLYL